MDAYDLTPEDVADLTGRNVQTVYAWRTDTREDAPSIELLRALIYDLIAED